MSATEVSAPRGCAGRCRACKISGGKRKRACAGGLWVYIGMTGAVGLFARAFGFLMSSGRMGWAEARLCLFCVFCVPGLLWGGAEIRRGVWFFPLRWVWGRPYKVDRLDGLFGRSGSVLSKAGMRKAAWPFLWRRLFLGLPGGCLAARGLLPRFFDNLVLKKGNRRRRVSLRALRLILFPRSCLWLSGLWLGCWGEGSGVMIETRRFTYFLRTHRCWSGVLAGFGLLVPGTDGVTSSMRDQCRMNSHST